MTDFARRIYILLGLLLCLTLEACGGGGGGGGTDGAPAESAADEPNSYFPTDAAARWYYVDASATLQSAVYFKPDIISHGSRVHALIYPTGGKEYYVTTAEQVSLQGIYIPQAWIGGSVYTADARFDDLQAILRTDWHAGQIDPVSGNGTVNISPTYGSHAMSFTGSIRYDTDGNVGSSTGIGSYAAKHIIIDLSLSTSVEGLPITIPYQVDFWIAEHVGILMRNQGSVHYYLINTTDLDRDGDGVVDPPIVY